MKKIFIAMAETQDMDRVFGNAYTTYEKAADAAKEMVKEIEGNMDWKLIPLVEEIELIEE
ncbi:hypothetical protein UFOVP257_61 [uncultured Caudovirales phage]|uniref:Uncharacterized protein n=1 Tax=uncultured Caudovirales phage TaxID=2100421 RepID=A0A6J5LHX8_9CAUD|nr:hypothetical protein UFOVP257_61 [uncultured Caudovirales phage]